MKAGDLIVTQVTDDVVAGAAVQTHMAKATEDQPLKPQPQNTPPGGTSRYGNIGITDEAMQGQAAQQNQGGGQHGKAGGSGGKASTSQSKP